VSNIDKDGNRVEEAQAPLANLPESDLKTVADFQAFLGLTPEEKAACGARQQIAGEALGVVKIDSPELSAGVDLCTQCGQPFHRKMGQHYCPACAQKLEQVVPDAPFDCLEETSPLQRVGRCLNIDCIPCETKREPLSSELLAEEAQYWKQQATLLRARELDRGGL